MIRSFGRKHRRWIIIASVAVLLILIVVVPSPSTSVGALLYSFVRGCPESEMVRRSDSIFLVIGHRGAAGYEVENTIPSMERAIMIDSANALEIDLSMTADSVIFLWHDWDPDGAQAKIRANGGEPYVLATPRFPDEESPLYKPIVELRSEQFLSAFGYAIKEKRADVKIPTLDEFMTWAAPVDRIRMVFLDIKIPERYAYLASIMMRRIDSIVRRYNPRFRVAYLTPYESIYREIRSALPEADVSFDAEPPPGIVLEPCDNGSVRRAIAHNEPVASVVHPYTSTVMPWTATRRILACDLELRALHNRKGGGAPVDMVIASTINDADKQNCLIGMGIDGLITDYPDSLRARARSMGLRVE